LGLRDLAELARPADARVVLLVLDGLGGLPMEPGGRTELETADTPNFDDLVRRGGCGLHEPVAPGITPGSGPAHLGLFGYDPLRYRIGRGVLEALGIGFDLVPGDVAARGNLATLDADGNVSDRRAGRISTEAAEPVVRLLDEIEVEGVEVHAEVVKEHRLLLVLRFPGATAARVSDTDPGRTGAPPGRPRAADDASRPAAEAARAWLEAAEERLADRGEADTVLLRGFSTRPDWPRFPDVFGMRALAVAAYPMYRGVARLVGMEAVAVEDRPEAAVAELEARMDEHDFVFLHLKAPDRAGEDGDFDRKVAVIEEVDALVPRFREAGPEVLLVTGDHSTPARLKSHSWHPVPFLLSGGAGRSGPVTEFGESQCARGVYGLRRARDLMPLAAARAGRLARFGA
jgi:2,3-bisphosphoglycerate-independent phosphoglycerate mutase